MNRDWERGTLVQDICARALRQVEASLQEAIDEEGCGAAFCVLKLDMWAKLS